MYTHVRLPVTRLRSDLPRESHRTLGGPLAPNCTFVASKTPLEQEHRRVSCRNFTVVSPSFLRQGWTGVDKNKQGRRNVFPKLHKLRDLEYLLFWKDLFEFKPYPLPLDVIMEMLTFTGSYPRLFHPLCIGLRSDGPGPTGTEVVFGPVPNSSVGVRPRNNGAQLGNFYGRETTGLVVQSQGESR